MNEVLAIVNQEKIKEILNKTLAPNHKRIIDILTKAKEKHGLMLEEVAILLQIEDNDLLQEVFKTAAQIKEEIYGERLVFFAPLYVSDFCINDCEYCNFHIRNKELKRRKLSLDEVEEQTRFLLKAGHKRILLECGEDPVNNNIDYIVEVIEKIYSIKTEKGNIRRINVNVADTTVEDYKKLKQAKIGTYQLFQETYHRQTYERLHHGPKANYDRQITTHIWAFEAGLDDLGIGVLFGLYDWKFEVLSLVSHAQYLDKKYGVGPHTISVPRFRPAPTVSYKAEYPVSDSNFLKIVATLRLAVPYTGLILSTREKPELRKCAFNLGISQASAGSVTIPGGYGKNLSQPQFNLQDERSLNAVIKDVVEDKLLPSFCAACYRAGRTGERFMELSKPGEIHKFCRPNGLLTFAEYLEDFADDGLYEKGYKLIDYYLNKIESKSIRRQTIEKLAKIKQGQRDLYF